MRTVNLTIGASGEVTAAQGGGFVAVVSVSDASAISITWLLAGATENGTVTDVYVGERLRPGFDFSGLRIRGNVGAQVQLRVGSAPADTDLADVTALVTNTVAQAIPVDVQGTLTLTPDVEVNNTDVNPVPVKLHTADLTDVIPVREKLGATLADVAPVAVDDVGVVVLAAAAARRSFRLRNAGANPVALVQANATAYADAAVIIQSGETWIETDGAACAWRAKCAAGLASTLNIQTVSE